MAVQQIGLGCKSSKKSLSTKAAHFSNANTVCFIFFFSLLFLSFSFFFFYLLVMRRGKTSFPITQNTLTCAYLQWGCLILALRVGQL